MEESPRGAKHTLAEVTRSRHFDSARMLNGTTDVSRLRSTELSSSHPGIDAPYGQSISAINALVEARSGLRGRHKVIDVLNERLLCYDFAASEASGASELASEGYFNEFDLPPWDTWVTDYKPAHEHNGLVLAFVPPSFNDLVQLGIDANPVNCVFWLDASDAYATKRVKHVMPKWMTQFGKANLRQSYLAVQVGRTNCCVRSRGPRGF